MAESNTARRIEKTAVAKATPRPYGLVTWPEVLRAVSGDETRSYVIQRLRGAGFSADDFGHQRKAREVVADALTPSEDRLELSGPKAQVERAAIRDARRRLEWELWP